MPPKTTDGPKPAAALNSRERVLRQFWQDYQWPIVGTLIVFALGLG